MDELKPCPFCGGHADLIEHRFFDEHRNDWEVCSYSIECGRCFASSFKFYKTKEEAVKRWNTRNGGADNA